MMKRWKLLLCWLTGHSPDGRGDVLNHCPRCGQWKLSVDPMEPGK